MAISFSALQNAHDALMGLMRQLAPSIDFAAIKDPSRQQAREVVSALTALGDRYVSSRVVDGLRELLAHEMTVQDGVFRTLGVAGAVLAINGPDAILPEVERSAPLDLVISRGPDQAIGALKERSLATGGWGERLFEGAKRHRPDMDDRIFRAMVADRTTKKRFIATVDATTGQDEPATIGRLLRQNFPLDESNPIPPWMDLALRAGGMVGAVPLLNHAVRGVMRGQMRRATDRFFIGDEVDKTVARALALQDGGYLTSLVTVSERAESRVAADTYLGELRAILEARVKAERSRQSNGNAPPLLTPGEVPVIHMSTKPTGFSHRLDPVAESQVLREGGARYLEFLQGARDHTYSGIPVMVNLDMEEDDTSRLATRLVWRGINDPSLGSWDYAAQVHQAYRLEAAAALVEGIHLATLTGKHPQFRIVNGAYHTYELIWAELMRHLVAVFRGKDEGTFFNWMNLAQLCLFNSDRVRTAGGSQNLATIAFLLTAAESLGLSLDSLEVQLLLGLHHLVGPVVIAEGLTTRLYAPGGKDPESTPKKGMPYSVRRLDEVGPESAFGQVEVVGSLADYVRGVSQDGAPILADQSPRSLSIEPEPHWHHGAVREAMQEAVERVQAREPQAVGPWLGEEEVCRSAEPLDSRRMVNPANREQTLSYVRLATSAEVDTALRQSQQDAESWAGLDPAERRRRLERAADLMMGEEYQYLFAATEVAEVGKPWRLALDGPRESANNTRNYARWGEAIAAEGRKPRGVGVAFGPYNFGAILASEIAAGAAGGNAMIAVGSERAPMISRLIVAIFREAGVPVQLIPGEEAAGRQLIAFPLIDYVHFTGSEGVARQIARSLPQQLSARGRMKIGIFETSGVNDVIVHDTADLEVALEATTGAAHYFAGQRCTAVQVEYVFRRIAAEWIRRRHEMIESLVVGDPRDPEVQVSPLVDERAAEKVRGFLRHARERGYSLRGQKIGSLASRGFFVPPVLISGAKMGEGVDPEDRLVREEVFGPLSSVVVVDSLDEVLRHAERNRYALGSGAFSRDQAFLSEYRRRRHAGQVATGKAGVAARIETPFGGGGSSGTGPKAGLRELVERVTVARDQRVYHVMPSLFPPTEAGRARPNFEKLESAQRQWTKDALRRRLAWLRRLQEACQDDTWVVRDLELCEQQLPQLLTPQLTEPFLAQRNELVYDWPRGVGLVWTIREKRRDILLSAVAALAMGNGVVLQESEEGRRVAELLWRSGISRSLLQLDGTPPGEILRPDHYEFRFVSVHGPDAPQVHRDFHAMDQNPNPVGYRAVIDEHDLRRYAESARTLVTWNLSHGANLDYRTYGPRRRRQGPF